MGTGRGPLLMLCLAGEGEAGLKCTCHGAWEEWGGRGWIGAKRLRALAAKKSHERRRSRPQQRRDPALDECGRGEGCCKHVYVEGRLDRALSLRVGCAAKGSTAQSGVPTISLASSHMRTKCCHVKTMATN
jgi:hypothetical protein